MTFIDKITNVSNNSLKAASESHTSPGRGLPNEAGHNPGVKTHQKIKCIIFDSYDIFLENAVFFIGQRSIFSQGQRSNYKWRQFLGRSLNSMNCLKINYSPINVFFWYFFIHISHSYVQISITIIITEKKKYFWSQITPKSIKVCFDGAKLWQNFQVLNKICHLNNLNGI